MGKTEAGMRLSVDTHRSIPDVMLPCLRHRQRLVQDQTLRLKEDHVFVGEVDMSTAGQQEH